ncbi:LOW QUALITY PROTEIN: hypothetical protein HZS_1886 [Henneguya salminicola]|nr:LOW QUALITY PROTEIN: hypothetical protein HZS_1886 [Henneguya salminicola]
MKLNTILELSFFRLAEFILGMSDKTIISLNKSQRQLFSDSLDFEDLVIGKKVGLSNSSISSWGELNIPESVRCVRLENAERTPKRIIVGVTIVGKTQTTLFSTIPTHIPRIDNIRGFFPQATTV